MHVLNVFLYNWLQAGFSVLGRKRVAFFSPQLLPQCDLAAVSWCFMQDACLVYFAGKLPECTERFYCSQTKLYFTNRSKKEVSLCAYSGYHECLSCVLQMHDPECRKVLLWNLWPSVTNTEDLLIFTITQHSMRKCVFLNWWSVTEIFRAGTTLVAMVTSCHLEMAHKSS